MSTGLESLKDLNSKPRGGRVNSLVKIPDALCRLGYNCFVVSDIKEGGATENNSIWLYPDEEYILDNSWDVLVCNRGAGKGYPEIEAKKRVLWTHDLPHTGFAVQPKLLKAFDRVVFMSEYARAVWRTFFPTIGKSVIIPNGVDEIFHPREKDLDYLIYISNPNRGLKKLPLIYEAIKSRTRDSIHMKAFSNAKQLHPVENDLDDGYDLAYKECEEIGILHDPVPQSELAEELGKAGLMILPTNYPEICSNSILQSLASGTPIVTTGNLGSANEWIKHKWNGFLTNYHVEDYMVHTVEIVRGAMEILNDPKKHRQMIKNASSSKGLSIKEGEIKYCHYGGPLYSWEEIGKKWAKMLRGL